MSEDYVIEWDKDFADELNVVARVFFPHEPTLWSGIVSQLATTPEIFEDEDEDEYGLQNVLDCSGGDLGNDALGQAFLQILRNEGLMNRPGFPGECFICELRLPDHYFRWKHNKLFLLLPEEYGPAFPAIVDCYTSPPTLVWPVPLLSGFSSSYGVLPPLCKDH